LTRVRLQGLAAGAWAAVVGVVVSLVLQGTFSTLSTRERGQGWWHWLSGLSSSMTAGDFGALLSIHAILLPLLWICGLAWGALVTWPLRRTHRNRLRDFAATGALAGAAFGALVAAVPSGSSGVPLGMRVALGVSVGVGWVVGLMTYWRLGKARSAAQK
jgi:hypothetical protein